MHISGQSSSSYDHRSDYGSRGSYGGRGSSFHSSIRAANGEVKFTPPPGAGPDWDPRKIVEEQMKKNKHEGTGVFLPSAIEDSEGTGVFLPTLNNDKYM